MTRHAGPWLIAAALVIGSATLAPAKADRHDFHGREYHHFNAHERTVWRGGRWHHGWHDGRFAWWWEVDGFWYYYPQPAYPYPTYVPPVVVVAPPPPPPGPPPAPPVVVVRRPPPPPPAPAVGLPPAQFWYYCDNPRGYYPYVSTCRGTWAQVAATPQPAEKQ